MSYNFKTYTIYDGSGKTITTSDEWKDEINVGDLPSGTYYYSVQTEGNVYAKPFIRY